jgi:hypothetical protein
MTRSLKEERLEEFDEFEFGKPEANSEGAAFFP